MSVVENLSFINAILLTSLHIELCSRRHYYSRAADLPPVTEFGCTMSGSFTDTGGSFHGSSNLFSQAGMDSFINRSECYLPQSVQFVFPYLFRPTIMYIRCQLSLFSPKPTSLIVLE